MTVNVLHFTTWNQRCGVADFAANIIDQLDRLGIENEIFPVPTHETKLMTRTELLDFLRLFPQRAEAFDLVHIQHQNGFFAGSDGIAEAVENFVQVLESFRQSGQPVVVTFHEEPSFWAAHGGDPDFAVDVRSPWTARVKTLIRQLRGLPTGSALREGWRKLIAFFDGNSGQFRALVHTRRTRLGLIRSGFAPNSVGVMPLGFELRDAARLNCDRQQAKRTLGLPENSLLLSIFGFVAEYKGHPLAVEALRKLPPEYHLAIVGGVHPENQSDLTLDRVLQVWEGEDPNRLIITGYADRETIDRYHAATDICLAPFVPSPLSASASLTWALTSGKPTIASNIPAVAEVQRDADCLLLFTPNAVHELAWKIQKLACDPSLQNTLVHNALRYAEANTWIKVVKGLVAVYQDMLKTWGTNQPEYRDRTALRKAG